MWWHAGKCEQACKADLQVHGTVIRTQGGSKETVIKCTQEVQGLFRMSEISALILNKLCASCVPLMTASLCPPSVLITVPRTCKPALYRFLHLYIGQREGM